ncbi:MAG: sugar phosphate nucleotidyltransferase [bacterium]|nr:sugar phosphate nucleotidyltransferase [bacterium]
MVYGVILAGGRGERFWPESRRKHPKQLLPIVSSQPMLLETVDRILPLIPIDRIIIVAGKELKSSIKKLLPNACLLLEPFGRNTGCAIGYATINLNPADIMVVLPADHYIPDRGKFLQALDVAIKFAKKGWLTTFGIVPTRAETGYGYIEIGNKIDINVYEAKGFKEKPNQKQAQSFVREKRFLWNSGMFIWTQKNILNAFRTHMPELYQDLLNFRAKKISLLTLYRRASNISIDYGVMEKATNVAVVRSNFIWDDIGSWLALERLYKADKYGNIKAGLHKGLGTRNCIVVSDKGAIATIGISNLIIVKSKDAVFVCDKHRVGDIKELVRELSQDKKFTKYL